MRVREMVFAVVLVSVGLASAAPTDSSPSAIGRFVVFVDTDYCWSVMNANDQYLQTNLRNRIS
jgi:hypothetical protein